MPTPGPSKMECLCYVFVIAFVFNSPHLLRLLKTEIAEVVSNPDSTCVGQKVSFPNLPDHTSKFRTQKKSVQNPWCFGWPGAKRLSRYWKCVLGVRSFASKWAKMNSCSENLRNICIWEYFFFVKNTNEKFLVFLRCIAITQTLVLWNNFRIVFRRMTDFSAST